MRHCHVWHSRLERNCHWWHGLISVLPLVAIGHGLSPAALDMIPATALPLGYAPPPWEGSHPEGSLPGPVTAASLGSHPVESPLRYAQPGREHADHRAGGQFTVECRYDHRDHALGRGAAAERDVEDGVGEPVLLLGAGLDLEALRLPQAFIREPELGQRGEHLGVRAVTQVFPVDVAVVPDAEPDRLAVAAS